MPRGHGRTIFISDKAPDRRSFTLSKRSLELRNRKLQSKENLIVVPVLKNCEDRHIVLKFLTLDVHLWRLLMPFTSFVQGPELRKEQGSQNLAIAGMSDGPDSSYSQPTIFIQFDLPKEPQPNKKFTEIVLNSSPGTLPESYWLNYGSDFIASNPSADAPNEADKPAKQSSRKKGKKKRKKFKGSMQKNVHIKPENQTEEVNWDMLKSETMAGGDLDCLEALENNVAILDPSDELAEQRSRECCVRDCAIGAMKRAFDPNDSAVEIAKLTSDQFCETNLIASIQSDAEIDIVEMTNVSIVGECKEDDLSSECEKDVAETDFSSERLLNSSQASSSDDFRPVIRSKRGRMTRKFSGSFNGVHGFRNSHFQRRYEVDNTRSVWQKVEKASTYESACSKNSVKVPLKNGDISSPIDLNQNRSVKTFRLWSANEMGSSQSYSSIVSSIAETKSGHISTLELQIKPILTSEQENQESHRGSISDKSTSSKISGTVDEFACISQSDDGNALLRSAGNSMNVNPQNTAHPDNTISIPQNASLSSQEFSTNSSNLDRSYKGSQVCSRDIGSEPRLQKCVPNTLSSSSNDELTNSNSPNFLHLSAEKIRFSSSSSNSMDCSSLEESSDLSSPSGCHFSHGTKEQDFPHFENDLTKIVEAINESHRLSAETDGIQQDSGNRLAGFERVLRSASPLIETGCINQCNGSVSLKRLWQWYEKPGSYGLEVKLDDSFDLKRLKTGLSQCCVYFVPYLSAVQLFARSGKPIDHSDDVNDMTRACEVCATSKYSTRLTSLPIFSKLLPQPYKMEVSKEHIANELLFEYFDSDQPQQRKPLFDKIQELMCCKTSSDCLFLGNSSNLGSLNLNELHPASWYAVAWYPIYRIPDGSFRAAFLTYHSFSHFARRHMTSSCNGCINSLSLPVVGLQSYNAQGEFWFEPANLDPKAVPKGRPSEEMKGRLQSLEHTAYVMSRATVLKGNLSSANRHPDYEFFLSRRR